jgi:hypothetical protein
MVSNEKSVKWYNNMQQTVSSMLVYESVRGKVETHVFAYDQWCLYLADAAVVTSLRDSRLIDHCGVVAELEPLEPLLETLRFTMHSLVGHVTGQHELREQVDKMLDAHHVLLARCNEIRKDRSWMQAASIHDASQIIISQLQALTSALAAATPIAKRTSECDVLRIALGAQMASCTKPFLELESAMWRCNWGQSVLEFEQRVDVAHAMLEQAIMLNRLILSRNDAHMHHCASAERQMAEARVNLDGMVDSYAQSISSLRATLDALRVRTDISPTADALRKLIPQCVHEQKALNPLSIESLMYLEAECKKQLYYKHTMDGRRSILQCVVQDLTTIKFTGSWWSVLTDLRHLEHRRRTIEWSTSLHLDDQSSTTTLRIFYKRMMIQLSRTLNERLDGEYGGRIVDRSQSSQSSHSSHRSHRSHSSRIRSVVGYKHALYTTVSRFVTMCNAIRQVDGLVLAGNQDRTLGTYKSRLDALHVSESRYLTERIEQCSRRCSDYTVQMRQTQRSDIEPIQKSVQVLRQEKMDIHGCKQKVELFISECQQEISRSHARLVELNVLLADLGQSSRSSHGTSLNELEQCKVEMATLKASITIRRDKISASQVQHSTLVQSHDSVDGLCARMLIEAQRVQRRIDEMRDSQLQHRLKHDHLHRLQRMNDQVYDQMVHRVSDALARIVLPRLVLPIEAPLFAATSDILNVDVTVENASNMTSIVAEVASIRIWRLSYGQWVLSSTKAGQTRLKHYHNGTCGEMKTFRFSFRIRTHYACRLECTIIARLHVKTESGLRQVVHTHSCVQYRTEQPLSLRHKVSYFVSLVVLSSLLFLLVPRVAQDFARKA